MDANKISAADALTDAFVDQLAAERAAAGLSIEELARRMGVSHKTLIRYLSREREMPVSWQVKAAGVFGISVSTLWERAEDRWRANQTKG